MAAVEGLRADGDVITPSVYKVTRQLNREQNSLFNCINSIVADADFVAEIRSL